MSKLNFYNTVDPMNVVSQFLIRMCLVEKYSH